MSVDERLIRQNKAGRVRSRQCMCCTIPGPPLFGYRRTMLQNRLLEVDPENVMGYVLLLSIYTLLLASGISMQMFRDKERRRAQPKCTWIEAGLR